MAAGGGAHWPSAAAAAAAGRAEVRWGSASGDRPLRSRRPVLGCHLLLQHNMREHSRDGTEVETDHGRAVDGASTG